MPYANTKLPALPIYPSVPLHVVSLRVHVATSGATASLAP
jgi:hypothetical protein